MRRYARDRSTRPQPLPRSLWGWIRAVWGIQQDDVVSLAGYDAAMYLRILSFGAAACMHRQPASWHLHEAGHNPHAAMNFRVLMAQAPNCSSSSRCGSPLWCCPPIYR